MQKTRLAQPVEVEIAASHRTAIAALAAGFSRGRARPPPPRAAPTWPAFLLLAGLTLFVLALAPFAAAASLRLNLR